MKRAECPMCRQTLVDLSNNPAFVDPNPKSTTKLVIEDGTLVEVEVSKDIQMKDELPRDRSRYIRS